LNVDGHRQRWLLALFLLWLGAALSDTGYGACWNGLARLLRRPFGEERMRSVASGCMDADGALASARSADSIQMGVNPLL